MKPSDASRSFAFGLAAMVLALVRTRTGACVDIPRARTAPLVKRILADARIAEAVKCPELAADLVLDMADDLCPDPWADVLPQAYGVVPS